MSRFVQEDFGQFQDSIVQLPPVRFTQKIDYSHVAQTTRDQNKLGIYDNIKLSSLLSNRQGTLIEFATVNPTSKNTFVTKQATELLNQYSTNQIALMVVMGNHQTGKSFFCDKILSLSEVKGNHFCRKSNVGLHVWSSPFQKDNLKVFLMQISGCNINSQQFRILSTYTLMIASVFVFIDDINTLGMSTISQADAVFNDIIDQILPSSLQKQQETTKNRNIFMPSIIYNLRRSTQKRSQDNLSVLGVHLQMVLPDALQKSYQGSKQDLKHVSFLDKNCINEQYIRRTALIFKQIHQKITQKRYKELILNGNIILKIIKYIETYINNKYQINVEQLYEQVVEDLYLSAFNYCILTYHQEMQKQFENEQPKSLTELLTIFEAKSDSIINKFNQFTLDSKLHQKYQQKLLNHINEKELMIMDINQKKTEIQLNKYAEAVDPSKYDTFKQFINKINRQRKQLTHGKAKVIAQIANSVFHSLNIHNNVDFKVMKEIERLKNQISDKRKELDLVRKQALEKSKKRSQINQKNETYRKIQRDLDEKIRKIKNQTNLIQSSTNIPADLGQRISTLEQTFNSNIKKIQDLTQNPTKKKNAQVASRENKLAELLKKIEIQQKLLRDLKESKPSQTKEPGVLPKQQKKKSTKQAV